MNYQAIRAWNHVWNPIAQSLEVGRQADAGYDAGEFSGHYHEDLMQRRWYEVLALVADRFGMSGAQLERDLHMAACVEGDKHMEAMRRRAGCPHFHVYRNAETAPLFKCSDCNIYLTKEQVHD